MLGAPFYGHSYKLANAEQHGVGAPSLGSGFAGKYSQEAGTVTYLEMCELMQTEAWKVDWDDAQKAPHAYLGQQWVGYDNPRSIGLKAQYAKDNDLGGVMVWSLESDDFRGICGEKFPLLQTINRVFFDDLTGATAWQRV